MMNKLTILLILLSVINSSCELTINVDDDLEYEDQLVLGGFLHSDSTITISVARSRSILENSDRKGFQLRDAAVRIFEDGILIGESNEAFPTFLESYANYHFPFRPKIRSNYRIEVEKNGFPIATAEESIPIRKARAKITDIDINDSSPDIDFTLQIRDRIGDDYYEVLAFSEFKEPNIVETDIGPVIDTESLLTRTKRLRLETNSLAIEEYFLNRIIFDDRLFEGSDFNINLTTTFIYSSFSEEEYDPELKLLIIVNRLSESYYNYLATTELQRWLEEDIFAEPVQIYSNVENGLGFIGSYNSLLLEVPIE